MAVNSRKPTVINDLALEMMMRDVLEGLTELSLESAYSHSNTCFEILDIHPPQAAPYTTTDDYSQSEADIIEFAPLKRAVG